MEVVTETVRHLGGPTEVAALRLWLAEHFVRVDAALTATAKERHRLMLAGIDVQSGLALYALQAPFAECRAALDAEPEIARDEPTDKERAEGFAEARDWFDDKSPAMAGRRLLGRILLGQVFWRVDEANLQTGRTDDINGLLRELGLAEIDFPPPPRRTSPPKESDHEGDYPADTEPDTVTARGAFKPLPPGPLSEDEASERLRNALAGFDTAAAAIDELTASGATLLEDVDELTKDLLSEDEYSFLISFLLHGWFALVPPGTQAPVLDYEAMVAGLARELERVPSWLAGGPHEAMKHMISGCQQPALLRFLMAEMLEGSANAPKKLRPKPEAMIPMITILKIMINEADRALHAR